MCLRNIGFVVLLLMLNSCGSSSMSQFEFFVGTWKTEGKEQFEMWKLNDNDELIGQVYKIEKNEKIVTETLLIKEINDRIIYEATVPNQNQGKTIQFILNAKDSSCFSFENMNHDFPNKIQYKKLNNREIEVRVSDKHDKGFSFSQIKQ